MNYISLVKWAEDQTPPMSDRRARVLASEGRIKGAVQVGRNWVVPPTAARPAIKGRGKAVKK